MNSMRSFKSKYIQVGYTSLFKVRSLCSLDRNCFSYIFYWHEINVQQHSDPSHFGIDNFYSR